VLPAPIGKAVAENPGFLNLRKSMLPVKSPPLYVQKEDGATGEMAHSAPFFLFLSALQVSSSQNRVYLDSNNLLLDVGQGVDAYVKDHKKKHTQKKHTHKKQTIKQTQF
jgi:hypothetical protein